jgi:predicted nuclease of predicted toxin-antitoxin system
MKFRLDENLHADTADLLRQHGHDCLTVHEQGFRGSSDGEIAQVCQNEKRVLVTLDLDFSDVRTYPPGQFEGIIVLRLPDQSRRSVLKVMQRTLLLLDSEPLIGHLWIVGAHHVRIRGGDSGTSPSPIA